VRNKEDKEMKKYIALLLVFFVALAFVGACYAEQTSGATYASPSGNEKGYARHLNKETKDIDHTHQYATPETDRNTPYGPGVDVKVWENKAKNIAVEVQTKYDIPNKEASGFVVAKVDLFNMLKKKE
jgi:hypothetical protein